MADSVDGIIDRKVSMARVVNTVEKAFRDLPKYDDDIASHFQAAGFVGTHRGDNCPVAHYLSAELAEAGVTDTNIGISVTARNIKVYEKTQDLYGIGWEIGWSRPCSCGCDAGSRYVMPEALTEFVANFDTYKYPFLDISHQPELAAV